MDQIYGYGTTTVVAAVIAAVVATALIFVTLQRQPASDTNSVTNAPPPNTATLKTCVALKSRYPHLTFDQNDAEWLRCIRSYWAAQARVPRPAMIVTPSNTEELSDIVKLLSDAVQSSAIAEPVQFAVKSGGHSPVQGFANVESGIVVDLGSFNAVELSSDRQLVHLGAAATWGMVYRMLEPYGLAVAGGRASSVGVGGLTLGGGLSFFSPQVGFVCDAMVEFEVVLSDGTVVRANDTSHTELAVALRGGGNNFGIVTRFTARTFPQTKVWFGHCFHYPSAAERLLQSYYNFCKPEGFDRKATCMFIFSWAPYLPFYLPVSCLHYSEATPNPPVFHKFSTEKRFWSTLSVRPLAKATDVIENMSPVNKQDLFHTTSFENDLEVMHCAHMAYKDSLAAIKKVKGMVWSLVFQPLMPSATLHHASNSMGINTEKTITVMHVNVVWSSAKDDAVVYKAADELLQRVESFARQRGVYHPYKYANYCSASQNPYAGYGADRLKFLRTVSKKYDPDGIFQKGVPGGHKLWMN